MTPPAADITDDERRRRRIATVRRRRRQRRTRRIAGVTIVVAALGIAAIALTSASDTIPPGVRINGVDVGGLTTASARTKLRSSLTVDLDRTVRLVREDDADPVVTVTANEIASGADIDAAIDDARDSRGRVGRALARVGIAPTKNVPLTYTLRDGGITRVVAQANAAVTVAPRPATVRVVDGTVTVTDATNGRRVDRDRLVARLRSLPDTVELPIREVKAAPTTAEAKRARGLADRIRATARDVTLDGRTTVLTQRALTNALRFPAAKGAITVRLHPDVLRSAVVRGLRVRETAPRNARITVDGTRATVVPSQLGIRFDAEDLGRTIVANPDRVAITARVTRTAPAFTTAHARALKIREKVGEFTTPYACCQNRTVNIQIAARTINGTILKPGERFSLNDALGERTEAKGYLKAPMIAGEELVDSRGGGVSQVATTVYNAAFFSGLEIIAHTPHSFYISRYPKGREATISHPSPDLVFRNDWDAGLYIAAYAGDTSITVAMYSSTLGRRVETTTGESTNIVQPKTIERLNSSLEPGTRRVIQSMGDPGFSVSYTRKVYRGSTLRRDEIYRWTYRPHNAIVEVGPPAPTPPTTTAPGTGGGTTTGGTGGGTSTGGTGTSTAPAPPPTTTTTP